MANNNIIQYNTVVQYIYPYSIVLLSWTDYGLSVIVYLSPDQ